jgi:hypothetical protein
MKRGVEETEVDVTADLLAQMRMEAFSAAEDQIAKLGLKAMEAVRCLCLL